MDIPVPVPPPTQRPIVVRPLREEDLAGLEWDDEQRRFRRVFRNAFDDMQAGNRLLLVAAAGNLIIGRLFIQWASSDTRYADGYSRAYLYALRVHADWQRHGIGTQLITAAESHLRARGFTAATIAVGKENAPALHLYQNLGYMTFADDPGEWYFTDDHGLLQHEAEPSWIMEKKL